MSKTYEFFLGGEDEEMREIKKIVTQAGHLVNDKKLSWGAKASSYKEEMLAIYKHNRLIPLDAPISHALIALASSHTPKVGVMTEIENDTDIGKWHDSTWHLNCTFDFLSIDHHGSRAGEPPAIIQICKLLRVTPTRKQCLIGAFDAGYAYGLESIGANIAEIRGFLNAPDWCKSVGEMMVSTEKCSREIATEAERAIRDAEKVGDCIIVRCNHNKTAPITARLYDHQKKQNILILSKWEEDGKEKTEANYYGTGNDVRDIANLLPGGWSGGAGLMPHDDESKTFWTKFGGNPPDTAFWGVEGFHPGKALNAVLSVVS